MFFFFFFGVFFFSSSLLGENNALQGTENHLCQESETFSFRSQHISEINYNLET